jgi:hypothetical protein
VCILEEVFGMWMHDPEPSSMCAGACISMGFLLVVHVHCRGMIGKRCQMYWRLAVCVVFFEERRLENNILVMAAATLEKLRTTTRTQHRQRREHQDPREQDKQCSCVAISKNKARVD